MAATDDNVRYTDPSIALAILPIADARARRRFYVVDVPVDHVTNVALRHDASLIQVDRLCADRRHRREVVTDEQNRTPAMGELVHAAEAFLLEGEIAYGEHLV